MQKSNIILAHISITYFSRVTVYKAAYLWTYAKGLKYGTQFCRCAAFTYPSSVFEPHPLAEVQRYECSDTIEKHNGKYSIFTWDCHISLSKQVMTGHDWTSLVPRPHWRAFKPGYGWCSQIHPAGILRLRMGSGLTSRLVGLAPRQQSSDLEPASSTIVSCPASR